MQFGVARGACRIDPMLRKTFLHVPGIGPKREQDLHKSGYCTWDDFISAPEQSGLPRSLVQLTVRWLEESIFHLGEGDSAFFQSCLPARERWRIWGDFSRKAVFLDIETTGLGPPLDYVTVVGLHDEDGTRSLVRGENLFMLPDMLAGYRLIVTFNGSQFDLPFLRAHMGNIFEHCAHIDLRFVLRRLGFRGGLKSIERQLGLGRPEEVADIDGFEAVRLWHRYLRGDEESLRKLVAYNRLDVENLRSLMEIAFDRLRTELLRQ